jgi:hypothetical protein
VIIEVGIYLIMLYKLIGSMSSYIYKKRMSSPYTTRQAVGVEETVVVDGWCLEIPTHEAALNE